MSTDALEKVRQRAGRRARRVRISIVGTSNRPRLSVSISNLHIRAQIIDDEAGKTMAQVATVGRSDKISMSEKADFVGQEIAKLAKKKKISQVVFDRGRHQYHGRIQRLAEAARKGGLEF